MSEQLVNRLIIGSRVRVVRGRWEKATGTIERWNWKLDESNRIIESETGAEIRLDPEWVGKLAGPAISVVVAKLRNMELSAPVLK